jgi:segregation and condensation protein A
MDECRDYMLTHCRTTGTTSFEKIFEVCDNRIHALFLFLSLLELSQQRFLLIVTGEGRNNFIVEYNENREDDTSVPLDYNELTSFN